MSDDDLLSRLQAELQDTTEQSPEVRRLLREAFEEITRLRAQLAPPAAVVAAEDTSDTVRMLLALPTPTAFSGPNDGTAAKPGEQKKLPTSE